MVDTLKCEMCGGKRRFSIITRCSVCKRMMCSSCASEWSEDPFVVDSSGNHPVAVCKHCDSMSKPYMQEALDLYDKLSVDLGEVRLKMVIECNTSIRVRNDLRKRSRKE